MDALFVSALVKFGLRIFSLVNLKQFEDQVFCPEKIKAFSDQKGLLLKTQIVIILVNYYHFTHFHLPGCVHFNKVNTGRKPTSIYRL